MFFQKVKPPLGMLGGDGMITFGADGEQVVLTDYGGTPVRSQDPEFFLDIYLPLPPKINQKICPKIITLWLESQCQKIINRNEFLKKKSAFVIFNFHRLKIVCDV